MNIWARCLTLAILAIVLSGVITAYLGGGLPTSAIVFALIVVVYYVVPKYRLRVERTSDSGMDE
ncbi:hypothetical protein CP556_08715 [Natrinema sp. CBA1119]|nr:hypothetical protein CP556_08715 [Natrinema sp. CBA1119]